MKRTLAAISFTALLSSALFGQTPAPKLTFDIADVHATLRTNNPNLFMTGGVLRSGRYDLRKATMLDLIRTAWNVDPAIVIGGPNWLETDRFDIVAKAPPATSPDNIRLMLQALLVDRFKLVLHNDIKPMPAFALTVGKTKPKLKEADGPSTGCQAQPQNLPQGTVAPVVVVCRGITMEEFARTLRGFGGDYLTNPTIDSTGLSGAWDFELKWNFRAQLPQAGADAITLFDALEKQLGLKLELQKAPAPVIVVDSVNETPSANSPEVAQALPPPPPAEFEVADLKLSMPDAQPFGRVLPGGRLELQGFTLKMLVAFAFEVDANTEDILIGMPKSADSTRYSLVAKAPSAAGGTTSAPQIDIDDLRLMLRAFLADRFKLATHNEDRPVSAYTLLSAKPKLTKADPANRTGCKEAPAAPKDPRDTNPARSRLITCQNMTMTQFAEQLQRLAPGYIHVPVLDSTGIEGNWDITLSFSTAGFIQAAGRGGGGGAPSGDAPTASDPNGGLTLFDAVNKQLGLKLEMQKRPLPVVVIDHVEEKPTDN